MTTRLFILSAAVAAMMASCGSDDSTTCECTPAARCVDQACECPSNFIPAQIESNKMTSSPHPDRPGQTISVSSFGGGSLAHMLSVVTDLSTVPVNQSLDLSKRDSFALIVLHGGEHAFTATSGTATFTHACDKGIGGSVSAVTLKEWGNDGEVPGGCALQSVKFSFTLGDACP
jgi:hypothetical protein